jgi:hypothetical protein
MGGQGSMPVPGGSDQSAFWSTGSGGPPNSNNTSNLPQQQQRRRSGSGSGPSLASGSSWMVRRASNPSTGLATEVYGVSPQSQGGVGGGGAGKKPPPSPRGALGTSPSSRR